MATNKKDLAAQEIRLLERVKRLGVRAMFSDDELLDALVLKGGNAMALVHRLSARASVDLDFSMSHDFSDGVEKIQVRIEKVLTETFRENGFEVFDLKMLEKPAPIANDDMADFWGGYGVEFKLISSDLYQQHSQNLEALRKYALSIGQGKKFLIDISRFEYTQGKQEADFDGYRIYVYSPEMIVCEKLRAICQQMPAYGPIIKRGRAGSARARDFIDIYILVNALKIDVSSEKVQQILTDMFAIKRVPLAFLGQVCEFREFHREDFPAVRATMATDVDVQEFDFYFDYALGLIDALKPLWNKEPPRLDEGRFPHPVG